MSFFTLLLDSRTLVSKWNTKLALIWKQDFGPLGNSPVLLLLSPGKTPLTTTVAKFLDTSVCGGFLCLDPSLSPFLVKFTQILESILLDNPHKAVVLSVGCTSFSSKFSFLNRYYKKKDNFGHAIPFSTSRGKMEGCERCTLSPSIDGLWSHFSLAFWLCQWVSVTTVTTVTAVISTHVPTIIITWVLILRTCPLLKTPVRSTLLPITHYPVYRSLSEPSQTNFTNLCVSHQIIPILHRSYSPAPPGFLHEIPSQSPQTQRSRPGYLVLHSPLVTSWLLHRTIQ